MWTFAGSVRAGKAAAAAALMALLAAPVASVPATAQGDLIKFGSNAGTRRDSALFGGHLHRVGGSKLETSLSVSVKVTAGGFTVSWRTATAPHGSAVALFLSTPSEGGYIGSYFGATIGGGLAASGTLLVTTSTGPRQGRPQRQASGASWPVNAPIHVTPGTYKIFAKLYKAPASLAEVSAVPQSPRVIAAGRSNSFRIER